MKVKEGYMIKIVDARMGLGKTSAAIQYMKDNPDKRYLFITPFIDETERIHKACPELKFWIPSNKISEYEFKKGNHLKALVEAGQNVAMTHALFTSSDVDTVRHIASHGYVVFIDEVIDVFTPLEISDSDIGMIVESGWLVGSGTGENTNYEYFETAADKRYQGGRFSDLFTFAKGHRLINISDAQSQRRFYFWSLHKELFQLSEEIYVLTYMFDGMPMKALLDMNGIKYSFTGVTKTDDGAYRFTDTPAQDHDKTLREKIHICQDARLNEIGSRRTALSATWTRSAMVHSDDGRIDKLRRNINTFFRNHAPKDVKSSGRLWCTFKDAMGAVRDKGFYNCQLAWTSRATNNYQDRSVMAYCVNIFLNPNIQQYFELNGVQIDPDKYALANMVQWIWRGCIRQGRDIWVYIPSKRMRDLLINWLNELAEE